jgi:hypothetical protein
VRLLFRTLSFSFCLAKGAKKVEVKYVTAQERKEQAAAAAGGGGGSSNVIFDMRGPNARILQTEQVSIGGFESDIRAFHSRCSCALTSCSMTGPFLSWSTTCTAAASDR